MRQDTGCLRRTSAFLFLYGGRWLLGKCKAFLSGLFVVMKMNSRRMFVVLLVLAVGLAYWLMLPVVYIAYEGGGGSYSARPGMDIHLRFIHSVQKTPVEEYLTVSQDRNSFELLYTRNQSFGVGLPFLPTEGKLRQEGDCFIMDGMGRHYPNLSFRPGLGTELTVWIEGDEYRLYELLPLGSRVDLYIAPRYQIITGRGK